MDRRFRPLPSRTTSTTTLTICLLMVVVVEAGVEFGAANVIADQKEGGEIDEISKERRRTGDEAKVAGDDRHLTGAPRYLSDTHSKPNYAEGQLKTARLLGGLQSYEISIPSLVDRVGDFISYDVTHRRFLMRRRHRRKRSGTAAEAGSKGGTDEDPWLFYRVSAFGREFRLNVSRNRALLAPSFVVEVWNEKGEVEERRRGGLRTDCLYTGHIVDEEATSRVALSNCDGLFGVFATESEEFFVEPLWNDSTADSGDDDNVVNSLTGGQRHVIYRRTAIRDMHPDDVQRYTCATPSAEHGEKLRWQRHSNALGFSNDRSFEIEKKWRGRKSRRRKKRSFSQENYVETLVVVDKQMVKYHGLEAIEPYVLTIMNIVAKLYHDASIGNDINIVVTRIIVLNESQKDLEITYHADKSLESFCRWQHRINRSAKGNDSSDALQHDTAILITRFDICTYKNQPCGTLGLAPVAGMCDPGRSCSIIEDIGIATAFTIAHELGHNFGMQHDSTGNVCGLPDHEPAKLMASQLAKNTEPFSWSSCSRNYITAFLDSGKGNCLRNPPRQLKRLAPQALPGQIHSGDAQCKYQFGPKSTQCHQELDMCRELWCYNPSNQCVTNSIPAAEGTPCSSPKVKLGWCYHGACMKVGWRPKVVNGQWNVWSSWSSCSRSCGGGVETSERFCTNPRPQHSGKYCIGERRRYRSCNIFDCPANSTDFREVQCSKFNDELFRGEYYKWKPFTGGVGSDFKPCALSCMAVGHHFYTERAPKVVDGTRCYPNSLDMCIDGLCMAVGCDGVLGSEAVEDKCRICGGDGTRCRTVSGIYDAQVDVGGESYIEAVRIPRGAMNILVTEKKLSRNYLALKSGGPGEKYFVNGAWTIDWPRQFEIANTTFTYEREKDKPETLKALGPTSEDLTVMLLMQEKNQGVLFEYSLATTKALENNTIFAWKYGQWSQCTATCSRGLSQLTAICVHKNYPTVAVSEKNCQSLAKFHNKMKYCNEDPCPPEWSVGDWTECSKSCGGGWQTRMISCIQKIDQLLNEVSQQGNCSSKKPKAKRKCNGHKCPAQWKFDEWSECRPSCGSGMRTRNVYCVNGRGKYRNESICDANKKPQNREKCRSAACPPPVWRTGAWGECSVSCGLGKQMRTVACRTYSGDASTDCDHRTMPHNIQECDAPCHVALPENSADCQDVNDVGYCPLVLKFKFCNRPYFRQMCCKTCTEAGV